MIAETLAPFSPLAKSIKVDHIYQHYKGQKYKVLGIARHSETLEELIVYQALYGEMEIWVHPLKMFLETIPVSGKSTPRFKPT